MTLDEQVTKAMEDIDKTLIVPDMHAPYHHKRAVKALQQVVRAYKPDHIRIMGDLVDFYPLSRFSKNPERLLSLQEEIDAAKEILKGFRGSHAGPITVYEGNHEYRLIKWLWNNPELSSLKAVNSVPALLGLEDLGIRYRKFDLIHGVMFKHGHLARKHSAATAKGEYEDEGTSGVSGHSHRLSAFYHTDRSGMHAWYEMGHLCDVQQAEYMEGKVPNWQMGFGTFEYDKKRHIWRVEQVPIVDNKFIFRGKTYKC